MTRYINSDKGPAIAGRCRHSLAASSTARLNFGWPLDLFLLLSRLTLGGYVLSAGWEKVEAELADGLGTFITIAGFENRAAILPQSLAAPFGYAWPWLEVTFGLLLMIGLFGRMTALVNATMLGMISFLLLFTGELFPRHHAIVFCSLALLLALLGAGRFSIDEWIRTKRKSGSV